MPFWSARSRPHPRSPRPDLRAGLPRRRLRPALHSHSWCHGLHVDERTGTCAAVRAMSVHYYPMAVQPLSPERLAKLRAAPLTYAAPGATATTPPIGYRSMTFSRILERRDFGSAVEDLMSWRVHQRAGLQVAASSPRAEPGAVLEMRLGVGPLALRIPCRVIYVTDEPGAAGSPMAPFPATPNPVRSSSSSSAMRTARSPSPSRRSRKRGASQPDLEDRPRGGSKRQ